MLPVGCPERLRCVAERKSLGTAEMPACDGAGRVRRSPRAIPVVSLHLSWLLKRMELNYAACKSMVSCWFCFSAWPLFHPACQSIGVRKRRGIAVLLTGQRTLAVVLARHEPAQRRCLSLCLLQTLAGRNKMVPPNVLLVSYGRVLPDRRRWRYHAAKTNTRAPSSCS